MGPFELAFRQFATATAEQHDQIVRKAALDVYRELVERSPVDTGRFRQSWTISFDAPDLKVAPPQERPAEKAVTRKARRSLPEPQPSPEIAIGPLNGRLIFIANGLPYARRLEYGWSQQAPAGLVGLTVLRWADFIAKAGG